MPNVDSGVYFFTALVPICNDGIIEHGDFKSSPVHMVRDALETLPTALQSPAAEAVGIQSPFARSLRTHFARLFVLDQPHFNGRDHSDVLLDTVQQLAGKGTGPLIPQPVDELTCPYLVVMINFDPRPDLSAEPRTYLEELWTLMEAELRAVLAWCYGFPEVRDARSFADFMIACQVETTMPFHDYGLNPAALPAFSLLYLVVAPVAGLILPWLLPFFGVSGWIAAPASLLLFLGGLVFDVQWVLRLGARPFPAVPHATLPDVLKALYLQQGFVRLAISQQGRSPAEQGAAFRAFLIATRPSDTLSPTQPPAVVRSQTKDDTTWA
jgi:hypothetical protein